MADFTPDPEPSGFTPDPEAQKPADAGGAVEAGLISGTPLARGAAAGVEAIESYAPKWARAPGDVPTEFDPNASFADRFRGSYQSIGSRIRGAQEAYPKTTFAASLAPALLPVGGAASLPGAIAKAGLYGAGQGVNEADDPSQLLGKAAVGAGFGALGGAAIRCEVIRKPEMTKKRSTPVKPPGSMPGKQ